MEMPPLSALQNAVEELHRTLADAKQTQREIFEVTGTAWSDDRFVKAVVGPRGQLVELELDPRIYRRPNSTALAATKNAATSVAALPPVRLLQGATLSTRLVSMTRVSSPRFPAITLGSDSRDIDSSRFATGRP